MTQTAETLRAPSRSLDLLAPSAQAELRANLHGVDRTAGVLAATAYLEAADRRSSDLAAIGVLVAPLALIVVATVLEAAMGVFL